MGILQARILEWVAMPSSRGSSQPRNVAHVSLIAGRSFTIWVKGSQEQFFKLTKWGSRGGVCFQLEITMCGINKTRFCDLILSKWFEPPTHGWAIEQLLFWEAELAVRGFSAAQGSVLPTPVLFKVMCISNAEGINGPKRTNDLETCSGSVLDQEKVTHRENQNLSMQRRGYSPGYSRPPADGQGLVPIEDPYPINTELNLLLFPLGPLHSFRRHAIQHQMSHHLNGHLLLLLNFYASVRTFTHLQFPTPKQY